MIKLASVLRNREWLRSTSPFPHVIAHDVFQPDFYASLCGRLQQRLRAGLSETPAADRFSRSIPGYDAYGMALGNSPSDPVSLFSSCEWRDMMCGIFGVGKTPYVFAGAHYHAIGSRDGHIHNDFNPVWFPRTTTATIQSPNQKLCSYKTGNGSLAGGDKIRVVRAAAAIFYLLNDEWREGDGGETALFREPHAPSGHAGMARCAPLNNSLLAFECTPNSFHTFLSNRRLPRVSIIMWVHRTLQEAAAKFGGENLEYWQ